MEFIEAYNLTGLIIGICTFLIIGFFSSRGGESGILLGNRLLVDFPRVGNSGNRGGFVGE